MNNCAMWNRGSFCPCLASARNLLDKHFRGGGLFLLEQEMKLVAFYCRQYAMEKGLEIKQKDTTGQVRA